MEPEGFNWNAWKGRIKKPWCLENCILDMSPCHVTTLGPSLTPFSHLYPLPSCLYYKVRSPCTFWLIYYFFIVSQHPTFFFLTCGHVLPGRLLLCMKASQPNKIVDGFSHPAACTASSGAMKASDHARSLLLNFSWISVCYVTKLCGVIINRSLAS